MKKREKREKKHKEESYNNRNIYKHSEVRERKNGPLQTLAKRDEKKW